jgi:paired small multidrug resistance pump
MMDWWMLVAAGLFEVVGVIGIKRVSERDNWTNNILMIGGFLISFRLLLQAMETISLSTAYAVWTGIGTVGGAVVGMIFFKESKNPLRILCILGIVACVAALRFVEP